MTKNYLRLMASGAMATAVVTLGFSVASSAQAAGMTKAKSNLSANDKMFVKKAYRDGMEGIANAKVAQDKAKDEATKDLANHMIADQSKANDGLKAIAEEEHLNLSGIHPEPASISGSNFDKEYLTMLQKGHEREIAMFEKEANDNKPGEDRDVPAFAKKTLPALQGHLQMIDAAIAQMK